MTPYSAVEHLALSLFFSERPTARIMGFMSSYDFSCYWDESGDDPGTETKSKSRTEIILVGGYFAHVREWQDFEKKWKPILDEI